MKLLFVVNPISGGVDKEPFLNKAENICHKYNIDYHIFKTTGKNDSENLRSIVTEYGPDKIASVGGDGTTLFTAIELIDFDIPMGIIPLGSANGMAAELFVNPKPEEALKDIIMSNLTAGLDMVIVNNEYHTIHIGDVGVNAGIVEAYEKDPNRGMATYAKYFIAELQKLEPFEVKVTVNDKVYDEKALMVGICNARKYGTGVPLNLTGNPMDGKFEIVLLQTINMQSLIKAGLAKFDEKFHDNQVSKVIEAEKATIEFTEPRLLQLDGEVIGKFEKLNVEVLKSAVKLITTRDNQNIS